jgi:8-oxo-dGTP diphosphatase
MGEQPAMKYPGTQLHWFVVGFALSTDKKHVVLIEKQKSWCKGLLNGVGGSIEEGESPLDAVRREFLEETGLGIRNWEFFCQLHEPNAVVEFFRAEVPFLLLRSVKQTTDEPIHIVDCDDLIQGEREIMPNLGWLIAMARRSCGIIASVQEFSGENGDDVVQLGDYMEKNKQ